MVIYDHVIPKKTCDFSANFFIVTKYIFKNNHYLSFFTASPTSLLVKLNTLHSLNDPEGLVGINRTSSPVSRNHDNPLQETTVVSCYNKTGRTMKITLKRTYINYKMLFPLLIKKQEAVIASCKIFISMLFIKTR